MARLQRGRLTDVDLASIDHVVCARDRSDLMSTDPGTAVMAGGTWMMSERQTSVTRIIDLTTLNWPALTVSERGLEIGATCTLAELAESAWPDEWSSAAALARQCCDAVLLSFKVQRWATVGGNICLALPAGAMTSLCAALEGQALIWRADGSDYTIPVLDLVVGAVETSLEPGDVLRSITIGDEQMRSTTAFRKLSLAPQGRSAAVVIGRVDPGGAFVLTVSAATDRPYAVRFDALPAADAVVVDALYAAVPETAWYDDVHGAPDWRRHITGVLAGEIAQELR